MKKQTNKKLRNYLFFVSVFTVFLVESCIEVKVTDQSGSVESATVCIFKVDSLSDEVPDICANPLAERLTTNAKGSASFVNFNEPEALYQITVNADFHSQESRSFAADKKGNHIENVFLEMGNEITVSSVQEIRDAVDNLEPEESLKMLVHGGTYDVSSKIILSHKNVHIAPVEGASVVFKATSEMLGIIYIVNTDESNYTTTIQGITLDGNRKSRGIYITTGSNDEVNIDNIEIEEGDDYIGGGMNIDIYGNSVVKITNSTFSNNHSFASGGGARVDSKDRGEVEISNCIFFANSSDTYTGGLSIYGWNDNSIIVENNTFEGNTAYFSSGGGMSVSAFENTTVTVRDSTFLSNVVSLYYGGGIYAHSDGSSSIRIESSSFINNRAGDGGGVYRFVQDSSSITIADTCTFSGNTPNDHN